jgi:hypothetical protein
MIQTDKRNKTKNYCVLMALAVLGGILLSLSTLAVAAVPALFMEQSTSITGASDTLKASRVPVLNSAGAIKYYEIEFKFQLDAAGIPVLAPFSPVVNLSPALLSGAFKAGKYKDLFGNVYTVNGPGATTAGRTNWNVLMTKPGTLCSTCSFEGSWTTGPIAGHPLETKITAQGIKLSSYSWGTITTNSSVHNSDLWYCSYYNRIVGFVQVGNQLTMHGFCNANNVENKQYTLSLCTVANPCP